MSYIGNTSTTQAFTPAVDFFNGNGSTVAFTLSRPVASVAQVQAVISNVPQKPGDAFTVSGNTITFTSAPPSGTSNIYVYYTSPITQVIAPGQGTVGTAQIQNGAVIPADLSTGAPTWNSSGNIAGANATIGTTNLTLRAAANTYVGGALALQDAAGTSKTYITPVGDNLYIGNNSSTDCAVINQYGVGVGPTVPQSGLGICFPATQSASSNANTLDDYEEGTWTPVLTQSGATFGTTYQTGIYTKVGNVVTITATYGWNSRSGGSGSAGLSGLPFAAKNSSSIFPQILCGDFSGFTLPSASYTAMTCEIVTNATTATFYASGSGVSGAPVTSLGTSGLVFITGTYLSN
jgi:hypothetical protein